MIEEDTTLKTDYIVSELDLVKGTVDHFTSVYNVITTMTVGSEDYAICSERGHQYEVRPEMAGKKVDFNVINGYAVNVRIDDSIDLNQLLLVTTMASGHDAALNFNGNAMFSDGSINNIDISKLNGSKNQVLSIYTELEQLQPVFGKYGYLAKYDEVNGAYELTSMDNIQARMLGFDGDFNTYADETVTFTPATRGDNDAMINGVEFADDAVIYVADVSGTDTVYSVISGADVATLTNDGSANVVYYAGYEKAADGHNYITFAFIKTDSISESADNYGILTSDVVWYDYNNGTDYATFSIWNGTEEVTITAEVGEMVEDVEYVKGDVIVYSTNDGKIINMDAVVGYVDSIVSYSATNYGGELTTRGGVVTVPADATVISAGADADADLIPAEQNLDGTYINNIFYVLDANDEAVLIVVDNAGVEINGINVIAAL